jgi:hypothetical protein
VDVLVSRDVHEKVQAFVPARAWPSVLIRGKTESLDVYVLDEPKNDGARRSVGTNVGLVEE